MLLRLRKAGLLLEVASEKNAGLLLSRPPDRVRVEEVLMLFRATDVEDLRDQIKNREG